MRVAHVVPSIQNEASGPSYSVPGLAESLRRRNVDVCLHVLEPLPSREFAFPVYAHEWAGPTSLGWSRSMQSALANDAHNCDIVHNHSLWMMPNVYPAWAVGNSKCRLVTSPRGTLSREALRQSAWKKRLAWWLVQGAAVRASACFHATCEQEMQDIRRAGLNAPVAVIPNGIDLPPLVDCQRPDRRRLLFLGRIHPIKGLESLLQAWRTVQATAEDWELHIVGVGDPLYVKSLEKYAAELGCERIIWSKPAYGEQKFQAYQDADLYVLPTKSENFGMTVAEALACQLPVIVTHGAPWQIVESRGCGWWIEHGVAPLADCLQQALKLSREQLSLMGQRGRRLIAETYSWERVGAQTLETYEWLSGNAGKPAWVEPAYEARRLPKSHRRFGWNSTVGNLADVHGSGKKAA